MFQPRLRQLPALLGTAAVILLLSASPAAAAQQIITSGGPLTNIYLNDNLACQATHAGDTHGEFYGDTDPGACGTFTAVGETVYGPNVPAGNSRTGYGLVSQSGVTGTGSSVSPFKVVTVVDAGQFLITQTDTYVSGAESYRTDVKIENDDSESSGDAVIYHAADCYLQDSDAGFGFHDTSSGGIYCSRTANNTPPDRVEGFSPLSGGSHFMEDGFSTVWGAINGSVFPDTCAQCNNQIDNGAGLSWAVSLAPNGTATRSFLTTFSPTGAVPDSDPPAVGLTNPANGSSSTEPRPPTRAPPAAPRTTCRP